MILIFELHQIITQTAVYLLHNIKHCTNCTVLLKCNICENGGEYLTSLAELFKFCLVLYLVLSPLCTSACKYLPGFLGIYTCIYAKNWYVLATFNNFIN